MHSIKRNLNVKICPIWLILFYFYARLLCVVIIVGSWWLIVYFQLTCYDSKHDQILFVYCVNCDKKYLLSASTTLFLYLVKWYLQILYSRYGLNTKILWVVHINLLFFLNLFFSDFSHNSWITFKVIMLIWRRHFHNICHLTLVSSVVLSLESLSIVGIFFFLFFFAWTVFWSLEIFIFRVSSFLVSLNCQFLLFFVYIPLK